MGWKGHERKQNCQLESFGHPKKLWFAFEGWKAVKKLGIYTGSRTFWGWGWMWEGMEVTRRVPGLWQE